MALNLAAKADKVCVQCVTKTNLLLFAEVCNHLVFFCAIAIGHCATLV